MALQDEYIRTALRLPVDVHQQIHAAADAAGRSFNAEIIERLQAVGRLQHELSEVTAKAHWMQQTVAKVGDEATEYLTKLQDAEEKNQELRATAQAHEAVVATLREELARARRELETARAHAALDNEVAAMKTQAEMLGVRIEMIKLRQERLEARSRAVAAEVEVLAKKAESDGDFAKAEAKIKEFDQLEQEETALKAELNALLEERRVALERINIFAEALSRRREKIEEAMREYLRKQTPEKRRQLEASSGLEAYPEGEPPSSSASSPTDTDRSKVLAEGSTEKRVLRSTPSVRAAAATRIVQDIPGARLKPDAVDSKSAAANSAERAESERRRAIDLRTGISLVHTKDGGLRVAGDVDTAREQLQQAGISSNTVNGALLVDKADVVRACLALRISSSLRVEAETVEPGVARTKGLADGGLMIIGDQAQIELVLEAANIEGHPAKGGMYVDKRDAHAVHKLFEPRDAGASTRSGSQKKSVDAGAAEDRRRELEGKAGAVLWPHDFASAPAPAPLPSKPAAKKKGGR